MKSNYNCIICNTPLTDKEMKEWYNEGKYCCNGHLCGCRGEPTNYPICDYCEQATEYPDRNKVVTCCGTYYVLKDMEYFRCKCGADYRVDKNGN